MPRPAAETVPITARRGTSDGSPARHETPTAAGTMQPPAWARELAGGRCTSETSDGLDCTLYRGADAAMASVVLAGAAQLTPAEFDVAAAGLISRAFTMLAQSSAPHAVRVWNFLPGIRDQMAAGLDRYRTFNIARYRALSALFGVEAVRDGRLPTASCLGQHTDVMSIHVLGAACPGIPIENPRQVPAFAYSPRFGPRPPCFSRATLATFAGSPLLMIAGTASVVGEESVHPESATAQLAETLVNLDAVFAEAARRAGLVGLSSRAGVSATRIYTRSPAIRRQIADRVPGCFSPVEWLVADICREELLVEVEVVAHPVGD